MSEGEINNKILKLADLISSLPKKGLDSLTTEQLAKICIDLLNVVTFCKCSQEVNSFLDHECNAFQLPEPGHCPTCVCCQTDCLKLYLAVLLEKLAIEGRLSNFITYGLTRGRIRNRCFNFESNGHKLNFKITRHPYAWTSLPDTKLVEQNLEFDFENLRLNLLSEVDKGFLFSKKIGISF